MSWRTLSSFHGFGLLGLDLENVTKASRMVMSRDKVALLNHMKRGNHEKFFGDAIGVWEIADLEMWGHVHVNYVSNNNIHYQIPSRSEFYSSLVVKRRVKMTNGRFNLGDVFGIESDKNKENGRNRLWPPCN
ncbi:Uncharacterized protein Fot_29730 [Forsythia ovata]|uniref:Uncharacterized protein n=1 Tax=Forsythia ovata TaxID=205694 RepID=A0ABD1TSQ4_9LAMI